MASRKPCIGSLEWKCFEFSQKNLCLIVETASSEAWYYCSNVIKVNTQRWERERERVCARRVMYMVWLWSSRNDFIALLTGEPCDMIVVQRHACAW